tara:strand:+ start:863 stop:1054 length:192 start_codon:yes stop_codon:yes gene_type:complete
MDIMDIVYNPFVQTLFLAGGIGYIAFSLGKSSREEIIATTIEYLIRENFIEVDKDGDIKTIKK